MRRTVQVDGRFIDWDETLTVEKIIRKIKPEFKFYIVKVDNEIVKKDQYAKKVVPENALVRIIPLLSGG